MVNRLKFGKKFVPCPVKPDDELFNLGIFVFNITRVWEVIENNLDKFFLEDIPVNNLYSSFSNIDEDHVDAVDISRPVLLAEITPGQFTLIDGNHRMQKAKRLGLSTIKAYRLNIADHIQFLTSKESYEKYVEYLKENGNYFC